MTNRDKNIVGEVLAKTYRIERFLGAGTVGTVYVARHVRSGGLYAIKVLHRRLVGSQDVYQRFQDEARLVATLRHPHIVPITDFDRDENGVPFFVMDLLEGESLQQRLKLKETLPLSQAVEILQQVGSALHTAHRSGIVHRNLKPENIFLVRHDLGDHVTETAKITDFGLARFRRAVPLGSREAAQNISVYSAPELLQDGGPPVDGRADQWALAVIAYQMLSGKLPFEDGSPEELSQHLLNEPPRPLNKLLPDLPNYVVAAINRGMAKRREDRYESTVDFVRAVTAKVQAGAPDGAVEASGVPQSRAFAPSGRIQAPAPPLPSSAVSRPAAPPAPPPSKQSSRPPAAPVPSRTSPVSSVPTAIAVSPAIAPAPTAPPTAPPALPPLLAPPPLLLPETAVAAPVATQGKSKLPWVLGGLGLFALVGFGVIWLTQHQRPQPLPLPPPIVEPVVLPPKPVVEAVIPTAPEAADQGTVPTPDAAARPAVIAPHVPIPPLRAALDAELAATPPSPVPAPGTPAGAVKPDPAAIKAQLPPGTLPLPGAPLPRLPAGVPVPAPAKTDAVALPPPPLGADTQPVKPGQKSEAVTSGGSDPGAHPSVPSLPTSPGPSAAGDPSASPAPKAKTGDELLREAQNAYVSGERPRAIELALQATKGGGADAERAWRFLGSAACSVRDVAMANRSYTNLTAMDHKLMLEELCKRNGLTFQNGQFAPGAE